MSKNKLFYKIIINLCLKIDKKEYIIHFFNIKNDDRSFIQIFNSIFIDNIFLCCDSSYNDVLNIYLKAKKIFSCLTRFYYFIKIKKAIPYDIQTDLNFNELSTYSEEQKITLLHNNTKYTFRLTDLINIIKEHLFHCQGLFSKPIHPRNPYINIRFTKTHLINIYIKLLHLKFDIPIIIKLFVLCNFNVKILSYQYFEILKENSITQFPDNCENLMNEIIDMIVQLKNEIDFVFKPVYLSKPEISEFINKLKKSFIMFLRSKYSSNPNIKEYNKKNVFKNLNRIFKFNKFKCISKKIVDISNNIIIRHNNSVINTSVNFSRPIAPPPPPPDVIERIRLSRTNPIPPPPPPPSLNMPSLIVPLLNTNTTNNIIATQNRIINVNNEPEAFRTVDNIPRSPIRNNNSRIYTTNNYRNNYRNINLNFFNRHR